MEWTSDPTNRPKNSASTTRRSKPFLGMTFECCDTYGRLYRDAEHCRYAGACPKCGRRLQVPIRPGGTEARFFRG